MKKNIKLSKFTVKGLYGAYDIALEFTDNRLILVGENGTGKTTCLKMFYYFITGQLNKFSMFEFDQVELCLSNQSCIALKKDHLLKQRVSDLRILKRLPPHIRQVVTLMTERGNLDFNELEKICRRYDYPYGRLLSVLRDDDIDLFQQEGSNESKDILFNTISSIRKQFKGLNFIYLPTYRRIESEIKDIFNNIDEDDLRRDYQKSSSYDTEGIKYIELVEFGMKDVKRAIYKRSTDLVEYSRESLNNLSLTYLGDIANHKYSSITVIQIRSIDKNGIIEMVNRADERILPEGSKEAILEILENKDQDKNFTDHEKIIFHYLLKLNTVNLKIKKKEEGIMRFAQVCSKYITNKKIVYNSSDFSFKIFSELTEQEIELDALSSGEKQIVSLFSYLYLSEEEQNYFIIIDEPELSLSVDWQRQFLQDISDAEYCAGFFAVTHSPFIFENDLIKYTNGINMFIK